MVVINYAPDSLWVTTNLVCYLQPRPEPTQAFKELH
jgi:hypothetical protein